jgi:hypothetical protein
MRMDRRQPRRWPYGVCAVVAAACCLSACGLDRDEGARPRQAGSARATIERALPREIPDRGGWTEDLYADFRALALPPTRDNVCAVIAVIGQESDFRTDPVVAHLGEIAAREIDARAARAGIPLSLVHAVLQLRSSTGQTYLERIDRARTEKELSDIYEDFIGRVPLGTRLFAERNPIRTRGPMQVNIAFAERYADAKPYPYPVHLSIADEVFTRRGSLYFGIAHLLDYAAPYDRYLFRFADFNAGQYASRNAAFQSALARLVRTAITPDGALLPHAADDARGAPELGSTEAALRTLAPRLQLDDAEIHEALAQGRTAAFESSALYRRLFALADQAAGTRQPRALVPRIDLHSPKIRRALTTAWYANRVDARFRRCLDDVG